MRLFELYKLIRMVERKSNDYVLKPQSEGGGHNFYGMDIMK